MVIFTFGAMVFTIGLFLLLLLITWPPLNEGLGQSGTVGDISATQLIFIVLLGHWLGVDEHVGDSGTVDGLHRIEGVEIGGDCAVRENGHEVGFRGPVEAVIQSQKATTKYTTI
jgi:hypothetical protein